MFSNNFTEEINKMLMEVDILSDSECTNSFGAKFLSDFQKFYLYEEFEGVDSNLKYPLEYVIKKDNEITGNISIVSNIDLLSKCVNVEGEIEIQFLNILNYNTMVKNEDVAQGELSQGELLDKLGSSEGFTEFLQKVRTILLKAFLCSKKDNGIKEDSFKEIESTNIERVLLKIEYDVNGNIMFDDDFEILCLFNKMFPNFVKVLPDNYFEYSKENKISMFLEPYLSVVTFERTSKLIEDINKNMEDRFSEIKYTFKMEIENRLPNCKVVKEYNGLEDVFDEPTIAVDKDKKEIKILVNIKPNINYNKHSYAMINLHLSTVTASVRDIIKKLKNKTKVQQEILNNYLMEIIQTLFKKEKSELDIGQRVVPYNLSYTQHSIENVNSFMVFVKEYAGIYNNIQREGKKGNLDGDFTIGNTSATLYDEYPDEKGDYIFEFEVKNNNWFPMGIKVKSK